MRRMFPSLCLAASALACGGAEPPPPRPVLDVVDVLVQDDFLVQQDCPALAGYDLRGVVRISGVAATCRLTIQGNGNVLSICGDVPGMKARELSIDYLATDTVGDLVLVTTEQVLDLTDQTRSPVTLDLSREDRRALPDDDDDGASNLAEICAGSDPRG